MYFSITHINTYSFVPYTGKNCPQFTPILYTFSKKCVDSKGSMTVSWNFWTQYYQRIKTQFSIFFFLLIVILVVSPICKKLVNIPDTSYEMSGKSGCLCSSTEIHEEFCQ